MNQRLQRTDAYANVNRIVAAARSLSSAEGTSATLAQVARRAGVGTATGQCYSTPANTSSPRCTGSGVWCWTG
nr:hypothetical protein [Mycobacterium sp.]